MGATEETAERLRFDERAVLVTGAGRGLGRAHALLLAERGASVVVSDVGTDLFGSGADSTPADETVAQIRDLGGEAIPYLVDLSDEEGARGAVRATVEAYGRIDALVHSAGFTLGGKAFEDESLDRLDKLLAINTRAAYALAREAWPTMTRQGHGRIVLAGSTALYGMAGSVPYATAKASYIGLTRSLASAGAPHGIRVNTVLPAGATRMAENLADSDFRSWFLETMRPELVAPVVALLSHEACPVNGEMIVAGGGRVARTLLVETSGYVNPDLTIEDVRDNLGDVVIDVRHHYPLDTTESGDLAARLLGFSSTEAPVIAATVAPPDGATDADHDPTRS